MKRGSGHLTALGCLLLATQVAAADGIADITIDGDSVRAELAVGAVGATLTIRFENVVGLSEASLGLSAAAIEPLSPDLTARLNSASAVPAAFPLLVRIEPPASAGLSFTGVAAIELYTHNLHYSIGTPLRLYSAPAGGTFRDITTSVGSGSYRSGGTKGDFSELLIVIDSRPLAAAIDEKYTRLSALLQQHGQLIAPSVRTELDSLAAASGAAYQQGAFVAAIDYIEAFEQKVREHSGSGIPDVWRSARDLANVAGALRAAAGTLRFSLTLASNAP